MTKALLGLNTVNNSTSINTSSTTLRQGQGVVTATVVPPIQTAQWARNGKHPNALCESQKAESANNAAVFRTKEIWRGPGTLPTPGSAGAGDRLRYRFAWNSGPFAHAVYAWLVLAPPTVNTLASYARLDITAADGSSSVSQKFYWGSAPYDGGLESLRMYPIMISVLPNTLYTAALYDVDNNNLQGGVIYELASLTQNNAGYLVQNFAQGTPILAENRQNLAEMTSALWKHGCGTVFHFNEGFGSLITTSTTLTNVLDGTSTTPSIHTPGWTIDMTGKARRSQSGMVPVMFAACGSCPSGSFTNLNLIDQTGTVICSVNGFESFSTPTWQFAACSIPATVGKYDLVYGSDGTHSFHVSAISCFEYEA